MMSAGAPPPTSNQPTTAATTSPPPSALSGPTDAPWLKLLLGGAVPALAVTVPVCLGYVLLSGSAAAGSVIFGAVLAMVGLAVGPLLLRVGRHWSPTSLMILAVGGYGAVVIALTVVFVLVSKASWLHGPAGAVGLLVAVTAWIAGQTRSTNRLRVLLYGEGESPAGPVQEV